MVIGFVFISSRVSTLPQSVGTADWTAATLGAAVVPLGLLFLIKLARGVMGHDLYR